MANLESEEIYDDATDKINIRRVYGNKGESQNIRVGIEKPLGLQFVTNGSIKVFNSAAEYWDDIPKGGRIHDPDNWAYHRSTGKYATAIATENNMEWYCILDPTLSVQWDGEVYTLAAGESMTLDGLLNKWIFLATASATIEGNEADQHTVGQFQNLDAATITAPVDKELVFAVFYAA